MNIFKSALLIFILTGTAATAHAGANHDMKSHDMKSEKNAHKPQAHKPWSMADEFWGDAAMAKARAHEFAMMGAQKTSFIMLDRLELQSSDDQDALIWDAQGWYGTDENKLWVKTEGEYSFDEDAVEDGEIQLLWSKPISTFWDVQAGLRYDIEPKGRAHAVVGVQGLAPFWFEVDAAAFLSEQGDITARVEAEYDMLLSQRLILQPRAEIEISGQDIPELDIGSGFTHLGLGLRLRYEIKREFAPYIGVEWQKDLAKGNGNADSDTVALLIGLRSWY